MEQRRLRLGDILDDYCPRERRVTNHAIVAMVEEDVKQTRCTTCDAEHPYKGGKAPRRRKKDAPGALYKEVLAGITDTDETPHQLAPAAADSDADSAHGNVDPEHEEERRAEASVEHDDVSHADAEEEGGQEEREPEIPEIEEGPVHRRLIRATLPRPEGQKDARPLPEFTVRQATGRGNGHGQFRGDARMKNRGGPQSSNRGHAGSRFAGARPGHAGHGRGGQRGPGGGFRPQQQPRQGGKKRSR